jgi:redox-sensitive bicupin YhaK (pirin superfamily)
MSGPVSTVDASPALPDCSHPSAPCVEVTDSRDEQVGKIRVRRALPRKGRRTVGAWCFADHMGPADVTENSGLDVGPHPHIGLQTVTWLIDGQVLHRDSLGSEQVIKPGQLNLMTSGGAVSHAEEATGEYRGTLEGIQLWVALPEATRHGPAAFEHHAELPQDEVGGGVATVLVGEYGSLTSPARHDTPLVGVDLNLHRPTTVPLRPEWEYAVVVVEGAVGIDAKLLPPGKLGYLGRGRDELHLDVREPTRAVLLGGEPFEEPIVMWWNFVGRNRSEIDDAYASWAAQDDRFGHVNSDLPLIPAKAPYWHQERQ